MSPDWKVTPLSDLVSYETGKTPSRAVAEYWSTDKCIGTPWVSIGDMSEYGLITDSAERITEKALRETFKGRLSKAGTLLMSFKLTIGRVATLGIDACHNEAIISIHPNDRVNQKYLEYFLSQVDYAEYQDRAVKGHTLNQEKINRIAVAEPPRPEQEKIAAVLSKVRKAIDAEAEIAVTVDELKRSAMRKLFGGGTRPGPQKQTELGPLPIHWDVVKLSDLCHLSTGTTPSTQRADYYQGTIPFIKTSEIINNKISSATTFISESAVKDYNLRLYEPGTVLMAMYGQGKTRGQVGLLTIKAATTQNAAAIQPSDECDPEYLWQYLRSCYEQLRGMGSLGHLSHLNLGYMREFTIAKPPIEEQREIASLLAALDAKIAIHRERESVLREMFATLLSQLMTGSLRVADLDIDTSTVLGR